MHRVQHVCFIRPSDKKRNPRAIDSVIVKIERIFESFVDVMLEDRQGGLTIPIKTTHRASKHHTIDPKTGAIRSNPNIQPVDVSFPGRTPDEAWRFGE